VLVNDGEVVGEGWHRVTGEPHAETHALRMAGERARGATAYVTLEPCSHHGRTPPCADALLAAGVARVVCAVEDPNPQVAGAGFEKLRAAGVHVVTGLLERDARELNAGFFKRMTTGLPRVTVKIAASLDGRVALASRESRWITGPAARQDAHRLRAESGAVLTGIGTVLADDPKLNVRLDEPATEGRQPLRVVLDSGLRLPAKAALLRTAGSVIVFTVEEDPACRQAIEAAGARVVVVEPAAGTRRVDLDRALRRLGAEGVNDVVVEAGPRLSGELLERGFVDRLVVYFAPHLLGARALSMLELPAIGEMSARYRLERLAMRVVGDDLRIDLRPLGRSAHQQD
jgi:diaminohydroxyphosphoribosylaminopyrimidine deaminase/5-amino-6-(5-phosphoribosylamino)uracil reductase